MPSSIIWGVILLMEIRNKIREFYNVKIIKEVTFVWGEQCWLQLDPDDSKSQPIISVVTVYPLHEQMPHEHFGYHEVLVGITGTCIHWCNNRKIILDQGKIGYISTNSVHHIINPTNSSVAFISIIYSDIPQTVNKIGDLIDIDYSKLLQEYNLNNPIDGFAKLFHMKSVMTDEKGHVIGNRKNLTTLCQLCIQDKVGNCPLVDPQNIKNVVSSGPYQCHLGVAINRGPIIVNDKIIGYLCCGFGQLSDITDYHYIQSLSAKMRKAYLELPFLSRNHLVSVGKTMSFMTNSLVELLIQQKTERELKKYKDTLVQEKKMQTMLVDSLKKTNIKFLESQVNVHFLFNTLNTIAQQAIIDGDDKIAMLTYALSNLLRLSLGKEKSLVRVEEELKYIKDYLYIQQTRFPDRFRFNFNLDSRIQAITIPLMSILVLVENAILHGFQGIAYEGVLCVNGVIKNGWAIIEVIDNGKGMPKEEMYRLKHLDKKAINQNNSSGLGINNIYFRLKHYFDGQFKLEFNHRTGGGTIAKITIPYKNNE